MPESGRTLYIDGKSLLHRLHPFNKLAGILLAGAAVYMGPGMWWFKPGLLFLNVCLALNACVAAASIRVLWRTLLPLAAFMILIHGIFGPGNRTILFSVWQVNFYLEGILSSANILLQLAVLLSASLLFAFTTHPADLIASVSQAGWPPSFAYMLGSPLLLLPAIRGRITSIQSAQRARGLESEGDIVNRFRALLPLVVPLVLGLLMEVEQRSVALEVRSFNASAIRTHWRRVPDSTGQRLARWAMVTVTLLLVLFHFVS